MRKKPGADWVDRHQTRVPPAAEFSLSSIRLLLCGRVAAVLIPFLQSPTLDVEQRDVMLLALELFRDHSIDYVDACLAAEARRSGYALASFDGDFKTIPDLARERP